MLKKVVFIVNPIFGINRNPTKIIQWIHEIWGNSGINYEILKTGHRGHGTELVRNAAADKNDMVVAVGGDGTINEIGRGMLGTNTALGIIPAGSGNGFARNVNIPLNQKKAIAMLLNPQFKKFDVGKINDFYFFNIAGAGLDAIISARFDHSRTRGIFPYFTIGVKTFLRYQPEPVDIYLEDRKIRRSPLLLSFANLPEFGVSATIAPNARPDDGLIDLCILNPISIGKAFANLPKLFNGKIEELPEMEIYQIKKAVIRRLHDGPIHTDGDPHHNVDRLLNIEVLPGQLKVAVGLAE
jgi:YegS/Rv2252/BmrU family lipid kinase